MLQIEKILDYIGGILLSQKVLILTGETGSGKTLKIPQLVYFLGLSEKKKNFMYRTKKNSRMWCC